MNFQEVGKNLGRPVSTYVTYGDCNVIKEQLCYTTELSRILLVGENRLFMHARYLPILSIATNPFFLLVKLLFRNPLVYSRFDDFIKNVGKFSQKKLQEAIEDALLLFPLGNTEAYQAEPLLNNLIKALRKKIDYINGQKSSNKNLDEYEELLAFVQELKAQLEADGSITVKLASGRRATLKTEKRKHLWRYLSYWVVCWGS